MKTIPLNIIAKAEPLPIRVRYPDGREEVLAVGEQPVRLPQGTVIYPPNIPTTVDLGEIEE